MYNNIMMMTVISHKLSRASYFFLYRRKPYRSKVLTGEYTMKNPGFPVVY